MVLQGKRMEQDDILMVYQKNGWDSRAFVQNFEKSDCYLPPLKLEAATDANCFLETKIELRDEGKFRHRLKNLNEGRQETPAVWRYQRYDSFSAEGQKMGVVIGCLKKVTHMASDRENWWYSLCHKLREFTVLGYPSNVLRKACARMYTVTGETQWLRAVRD